jgi:hypothetical protein
VANVSASHCFARSFRHPRAWRLAWTYGLTRASVHKVFVNSLDSLGKIWGPRIPRLLEVIKWRCLSTICPLTPQLLEKWIDSPVASSLRPTTRDYFSSFRLSSEAHVRLIAALDKSIPCWLETNHKQRRIDRFVGQFDLALARVVREAGGHITVAEAYRRLSHPTGWNHHRLTIETFLRFLPSVDYTVIEFKDPQAPIVRLRTCSGKVRAQVRSGQTSAPRKTSLEAIPFLSANRIVRDRAAVGP